MDTKDKSFKIIILGPPVSGKGTQAKLLSDKVGVPHISAGYILRAVKNDASNPLAKEVGELIDNGKLVPSEMINKMILDRIKEPDASTGFILDGYPRTVDQVKTINEATDIDYVFLIDVNDGVVIERLAGRRICKNNHSWHIEYAPTEKEGICDTCGEETYVRDDDQEDKVRQRLEIYHNHTDPILKIYEKKGKLIKINGVQLIADVFEELIGHFPA